MKTNRHTTAGPRQGDFELLQQVIEQQLRNIARRGFSPKTDNAAHQGWYKRVRQVLRGCR